MVNKSAKEVIPRGGNFCNFAIELKAHYYEP